MLIFEQPKDGREAILMIYDDKAPYNLKQEKVIDFPTHRATFSHDYRSNAEQISNKILIIGIINPQDNVLIKLYFEDDNSCKEKVVFSKVSNEQLYRCHTISNGHALAFYEHHLIYYGADLECLNKISWSENLHRSIIELISYCIAPDFCSSGQKGFICGF